MTSYKVEVDKLKEYGDKFVAIGEKVSEINDELNRCVNKFDNKHREISRIMSYVRTIKVGQSGNDIVALGSIIIECANLYYEGENNLINLVNNVNDVPKSIHEGSNQLLDSKTLDLLNLVVDIEELAKELNVPVADIEKVLKTFGIDKPLGVYSDANKLYGMLKDVFEGGSSNAVEDFIHFLGEKAASKIAGSTMEGYSVKMVYTLGKNFWENYMEHLENLGDNYFYNPEYNELKEFCDFAWGLTIEPFIDTGVELGIDMVDTGARLLGVNYNELLLKYGGSTGVEGAKNMFTNLGDMLLSPYYEDRNFVDGTISVIEDVGSYWFDVGVSIGKSIGSVASDFSNNVFDSVGGLFKW